jgi:hypothetical protein
MNKSQITAFLLLVVTASPCVMAVDTLYDNRFKQWQNKADKGDSYSQYSLGNAYLRGNEVAIDKNKALHWFKQAASQGHAKSQYKLGFLYYTGKGVPRNYRTAFDWFSMAAKNDHSPAQYYLGKMYASGQGTRTDYNNAIEWYQKALKNDYTPAAREIQKLQQKMAVQDSAEEQRAAEVAEARAAQKRAAKKIVVAKRSTPVKTITKKKVRSASKKEQAKIPGKTTMSVAQLLSLGKWTRDDEPAHVLPSISNSCNIKSDQIHCETDEILKTTEYADVNYKVESVVGRFNNERRSFIMKNKVDTIFVLPLDTEDPYVDPEAIPKKGLVRQTMKCKFETDNKIRCYNDDFQKVYFTRK